MARTPVTQDIAERNRFFQLLGECVTEWAYIERALFAIFMTVTRAEKDICAIIFWKMNNTAMKMQYTSDLIEYRLLSPIAKVFHGADYLVEWRAVFTEVNRLSGVRNNIAHQPRAMRVTEAEGPLRITDAGQFEIYPNPLDPFKSRKFEPLREADLTTHLKELDAVRQRIYSLNGRLQFVVPLGPAEKA